MEFDIDLSTTSQIAVLSLYLIILHVIKTIIVFCHKKLLLEMNNTLEETITTSNKDKTKPIKRRSKRNKKYIKTATDIFEMFHETLFNKKVSKEKKIYSSFEFKHQSNLLQTQSINNNFYKNEKPNFAFSEKENDTQNVTTLFESQPRKRKKNKESKKNSKAMKALIKELQLKKSYKTKSIESHYDIKPSLQSNENFSRSNQKLKVCENITDVEIEIINEPVIDRTKERITNENGEIKTFTDSKNVFTIKRDSIDKRNVTQSLTNEKIMKIEDTSKNNDIVNEYQLFIYPKLSKRLVKDIENKSGIKTSEYKVKTSDEFQTHTNKSGNFQRLSPISIISKSTSNISNRKSNFNSRTDCFSNQNLNVTNNKTNCFPIDTGLTDCDKNKLKNIQNYLSVKCNENIKYFTNIKTFTPIKLSVNKNKIQSDETILSRSKSKLNQLKHKLTDMRSYTPINFTLNSDQNFYKENINKEITKQTQNIEDLENIKSKHNINDEKPIQVVKNIPQKQIKSKITIINKSSNTQENVKHIDDGNAFDTRNTLQGDDTKCLEHVKIESNNVKIMFEKSNSIDQWKIILNNQEEKTTKTDLDDLKSRGKMTTTKDSHNTFSNIVIDPLTFNAKCFLSTQDNQNQLHENKLNEEYKQIKTQIHNTDLQVKQVLFNYETLKETFSQHILKGKCNEAQNEKINSGQDTTNNIDNSNVHRNIKKYQNVGNYIKQTSNNINMLRTDTQDELKMSILKKQGMFNYFIHVNETKEKLENKFNRIKKYHIIKPHKKISTRKLKQKKKKKFTETKTNLDNQIEVSEVINTTNNNDETKDEFIKATDRINFDKVIFELESRMTKDNNPHDKSYHKDIELKDMFNDLNTIHEASESRSTLQTIVEYDKKEKTLSEMKENLRIKSTPHWCENNPNIDEFKHRIKARSSPSKIPRSTSLKRLPSKKEINTSITHDDSEKDLNIKSDKEIVKPTKNSTSSQTYCSSLCRCTKSKKSYRNMKRQQIFNKSEYACESQIIISYNRRRKNVRRKDRNYSAHLLCQGQIRVHMKNQEDSFYDTSSKDSTQFSEIQFKRTPLQRSIFTKRRSYQAYTRR